MTQCYLCGVEIDVEHIDMEGLTEEQVVVCEDCATKVMLSTEVLNSKMVH